MLKFDPEDRPVLSTREREVLSLIAKGLSAKEVALRTSLSPRTVEHHIETIRHKLRARNRVHIVLKALAYGEISFGSQAMMMLPPGLFNHLTHGVTLGVQQIVG